MNKFFMRQAPLVVRVGRVLEASATEHGERKERKGKERKEKMARGQGQRYPFPCCTYSGNLKLSQGSGPEVNDVP